MLRLGRDPQELPRLEVDGDLDRKAGVPVEPLVRSHQLANPIQFQGHACVAAQGSRGSVRAMLVAAITGLGKTVLLVVAITFIAWALITAIFVPKRQPGVPAAARRVHPRLRRCSSSAR